MVLIILRGLNRQNNDGRSLFHKSYRPANKKNGARRLIRVFERDYNLAWIFFIKHYSNFCGCWWSSNIDKSNIVQRYQQ